MEFKSKDDERNRDYIPSIKESLRDFVKEIGFRYPKTQYDYVLPHLWRNTEITQVIAEIPKDILRVFFFPNMSFDVIMFTRSVDKMGHLFECTPVIFVSPDDPLTLPERVFFGGVVLPPQDYVDSYTSAYSYVKSNIEIALCSSEFWLTSLFKTTKGEENLNSAQMLVEMTMRTLESFYAREFLDRQGWQVAAKGELWHFTKDCIEAHNPFMHPAEFSASYLSGYLSRTIPDRATAEAGSAAISSQIELMGEHALGIKPELSTYIKGENGGWHDYTIQRLTCALD